MAYQKMNRFLPPGNDWSIESEFECWHPDAAFAFTEKLGAVSWNGGSLDTIKADVTLPFVDLPKQLEELIKHCWQKATASPGAGRGSSQIQLGGARQQNFIQKGFQIGGARIQAGLQARNDYIPMVSPTKPPVANVPHLSGVANDWKVMQQLERVNAYTFRGDSRAPAAIKGAGGFYPPMSRNDTAYVEGAIFKEFESYMQRRFQQTLDKQTFLDAYNKVLNTADAKKVMLNFSIWKAVCEQESLHVGRMLANEALKGYISTTRAVPVAKAFAKTNGWVYVTLVKGGFVVPEKGKNVWTAIFGEQEIALPVPLPWTDIVGFRGIGPVQQKFVGPIYFRKDFDSQDSTAFQKVHDLLSGKVQA